MDDIKFTSCLLVGAILSTVVLVIWFFIGDIGNAIEYVCTLLNTYAVLRYVGAWVIGTLLIAVVLYIGDMEPPDSFSGGAY